MGGTSVTQRVSAAWWEQLRKTEGGEFIVAKYREWLEPDGLTLLEGWARDGLTDDEESVGFWAEG